MAYYWFAKNVPELHEVQPADRREWLHVARQRSTRWPARVVMVLASLVAYVVAREGACREQWNPLASLLAIVAVIGAVALILDAVWLQPRARKWLREHLHEFRVNDTDGTVRS